MFILTNSKGFTTVPPEPHWHLQWHPSPTCEAEDPAPKHGAFSHPHWVLETLAPGALLVWYPAFPALSMPTCLDSLRLLIWYPPKTLFFGSPFGLPYHKLRGKYAYLSFDSDPWGPCQLFGEEEESDPLAYSQNIPKHPENKGFSHMSVSAKKRCSHMFLYSPSPYDSEVHCS